MKYLIAILFFLCGAARAQAPAPCPCWPWSDNENYTGMLVAYNLVGGSGPFARWACWPNQIPPGSLSSPKAIYCTLVDVWGNVTLEKLGGRLDTVLAKPVGPERDAAAAASWKRHVLYSVADPRYAAVTAELQAAEAEETRRLLNLSAPAVPAPAASQPAGSAQP